MELLDALQLRQNDFSQAGANHPLSASSRAEAACAEKFSSKIDKSM
jgi:hypothetical protein